MAETHPSPVNEGDEQPETSLQIPTRTPSSTLSHSVAVPLMPCSVSADLPSEITLCVFGRFCDHCRDPAAEFQICDDEIAEDLVALASLLTTRETWLNPSYRTIPQYRLLERFSAPFRSSPTFISRPDLPSAVQILRLDLDSSIPINRPSDFGYLLRSAVGRATTSISSR